MVYTPKQKRRVTKKIAIITLVIVFVVTFIGVKIIQENATKENETQVSICGYSKDKVAKKIKSTFKDNEIYGFNDYLFYGESLAVFENEYTGQDSDPMAGKTLKLKDVCSKQVYAFVLDRKMDRKVLLSNVKPGFYEMYIMEDLNEKRLYANEIIEDSIHSVTRNGENHEVTFLGNVDILKDSGITFDRNYAFLSVEEDRIAKDEYDVVIDPAGNDDSFTFGQVDLGVRGNDLIEASETFDTAQRLKQALEEKGLKVLVLRKEDQVIGTYGEDGRLALAYKVKAKYYIRLAFMADANTSFRGYTLYHSSHSTDMLAARIGYDFSKTIEIPPTTIYMGSMDTPGVIESSQVRSALDNRDVYDADLWLRESGGKATQAGMFSKNTIEGTASFAKDNIHGMNAIHIFFGYLSNKEDVKYWDDNKQNIVEILANSIAVYLSLEE